MHRFASAPATSAHAAPEPPATVPDAGIGAVLAVLNEPSDTLPACPHCHGSRIQRWGHSGGVQRFRCRTCTRSFNSLTGTPLARLRRRDLWLDHAQVLNEGLSLRAAGHRLGIHRNTTFRWRHRWLINPATCRNTALRGTVEVATVTCVDVRDGEQPWRRVALPPPADERPDERPDERRQALRKAQSRPPGKAQAPSDQRSHPAAKPAKDPIVVLIARDRFGATIDGVLDALDPASVESILAPLLDPAHTILCNPEPAVLARVAQARRSAHHPASATGPARSLADVHAYVHRLERWMRRFLGVSARYLRHYLGWRRLLDRHCPPAPPHLWLRLALGRDQLPTVAMRRAAAA